MKNDAEFDRLLGYCMEFSQMYSEGLVYIGGIAVYLHAINAGESVRAFAEATHDADFYISLADMGDLRDIEEVVPNRRLSKSQLIKGGFEFDIYTERQADLIIPFADVFAHSVLKGEMRVACLEHLFALKLEAWRDRRHSSKGGKDARDLVRIALVAAQEEAGFKAELAARFLSDRHLELFDSLRRTPEVVALASGNAVKAKHMRAQLNGLLDSIELASSEKNQHGAGGMAPPRPG